MTSQTCFDVDTVFVTVTPSILKVVIRSMSAIGDGGETRRFLMSLVGCVAQLAERRSLAGELTLSCARPAADG